MFQQIITFAPKIQNNLNILGCPGIAFKLAPTVSSTSVDNSIDEIRRTFRAKRSHLSNIVLYALHHLCAKPPPVYYRCKDPKIQNQ